MYQQDDREAGFQLQVRLNKLSKDSVNDWGTMEITFL